LINIALSTFLKIASLPIDKSVATLSRYGSNDGGFDHYGHAKRASAARAKSDSARSKALQQIQDLESGALKKNNQEIEELVEKWVGSHAKNQLEPIKGIYRSPDKVFGIKLEPELQTKKSGQNAYVALYCSKDPNLSAAAAGAGILLLQKHFAAETLIGVDFGILDVRSNRTFWTPTNSSKRLLESTVRLIEAEFSVL
jgi:hypothetical protein